MLTGGEGADTFEFQLQKANKSADVTITDFELGTDSFIVGGMSGAEWVEAFFAGDIAGPVPADLLTEVDGNAVLNIGFNDTVTFEGISASEFADFYLADVLVVA